MKMIIKMSTLLVLLTIFGCSGPNENQLGGSKIGDSEMENVAEYVERAALLTSADHNLKPIIYIEPIQGKDQNQNTIIVKYRFYVIIPNEQSFAIDTNYTMVVGLENGSGSDSTRTITFQYNSGETEDYKFPFLWKEINVPTGTGADQMNIKEEDAVTVIVEDTNTSNPGGRKTTKVAYLGTIKDPK